LSLNLLREYYKASLLFILKLLLLFGLRDVVLLSSTCDDMVRKKWIKLTDNARALICPEITKVYVLVGVPYF
jgi:hypothetical protein